MVRYYSVARPLDIGTFPKPAGNHVMEIVNFDYRRYVDEIGREAWGYIEYSQPLTPKEADDYELIEA